MKFILFLTLIFAVSSGYSQNDFSNPSFAIPRAKSNTTKVSPSNPSSSSKLNIPPITFSPLERLPFNSNSKPSNLKQIGQTSTPNFMQKNDLITPGAIYEEKLNKKEQQEVSQVFRKNQYLGDFKTKSTFVKILCRDHEFVDGDEVRIYINDIAVSSNIVLNSSFQIEELTLKPGFNKIDIEAINQGTSGPNTAEFMIYDEKGGLISSNRWNLATGFKATVIIVKD